MIASHVLEHSPDDAASLRDIRRILRVGGRLAALIPLNERYEDPNHVRQYTSETFRSVCEGAGFRLLDGFENERLFHLVERLYQRHQTQPWTPWENGIRWGFNVLTSWWPFWMYELADRLIGIVSGLPPRQGAFLFERNGSGNA